MVTIQIGVDVKTWSKINGIAKLAGVSTGVVVANLLKQWEDTSGSGLGATNFVGVQDQHSVKPGPIAEAGHESAVISNLTAPAKLWRSSRGEFLPVGLPLRATYLGKTYTATVTSSGIKFNGQSYESPSKAGVAVKKLVGRSDAAASTNGWDFWEALDGQTGAWKPLSTWKSEKAGY